MGELKEDQIVDEQHTPSSLLRGLRSGCNQAWERLYRRFGPIVLLRLIKRGVSPLDAEDIWQSVAITILQKIPMFRYEHQNDSLLAWIWTIVKCRLCDLQRRRNRRQHRELPAVGGSEHQDFLTSRITEEQADAELVRQELYLLYQKIVDELKQEQPRTWEMYYLYSVQKLAAADVADRMGVKVAVVHNAKYRISEQIQQKLASFLTPENLR